MKKVLSIILSMSLCFLLPIQVSAAEVMPKENVIEKEEVSATTGSSFFSKSLLKLNSINGTTSKVVTFTSGSVASGAQVTSVKVFVNKSTGSDPFIIYIQAPDGTIYSFLVTGSETIVLDCFNGCNPSGSWKIWIETQGFVSTANITLTVYYSY